MPTKLQYRQGTADRVGGFGAFTSTGGSFNTIVCAAAFASALLPTDPLDQVYVLAPFSLEPRQQRVVADGLAPTGGTPGTITLDHNNGSGFGGGSAAFEIHSVLPGAEGTGLVMSVDKSVALALGHLTIDATITLDLVTGQFDYALPDWLDRPSRISDVRELNAVGTTTRSSPRTWSLRTNSAGANLLHFEQPFRFNHGSFTIDIEAIRPADTLVNGTTSTVGLVAETDTAIPPLIDVERVALVWCYEALALASDGDRATHYARLYATQLDEAHRVPGFDRTNLIQANPAVVAQASGTGAAA